jgi:hypothetical protein
MNHDTEGSSGDCPSVAVSPPQPVGHLAVASRAYSGPEPMGLGDDRGPLAWIDGLDLDRGLDRLCAPGGGGGGGRMGSVSAPGRPWQCGRSLGALRGATRNYITVCYIARSAPRPRRAFKFWPGAQRCAALAPAWGVCPVAADCLGRGAYAPNAHPDRGKLAG